MIDDKTIEEAARAYANTNGYFGVPEAYNQGAHWAINKFLIDLWHPIEEKPQKGKVFLYQSSCYGFGLNQISDTKDWNYIIKYQKAIQWLYIDALL